MADSLSLNWRKFWRIACGWRIGELHVALHSYQCDSFFEGVLMSVGKGERIPLAAFTGPQLVGTVQLVMATPPNQRHRGEIAKLLVHRSARGQGVGSRLMKYAEELARSQGKKLLNLDTVMPSGSMSSLGGLKPG